MNRSRLQVPLSITSAKPTIKVIMMPEAASIDPFLNAEELLHRSEPAQRHNWLGYGAGAFALIVLASAFAGGQSAEMQAMVRLLSMISLFGLVVGMSILFAFTARKHREEMQHLDAAEELIQLRRWPQAALLLTELLSRPMRGPHARIRALLYLTSVLGRYHKFEGAQQVQDYLLQYGLDPATDHGLRLGRAMAMLRQDHLVDVDRAIGELRRQVGDGRSAGLSLVEMYRDVKTGHPAEAIEIFHEHLSAMRDQLGHRVADGYALAARAHDMLSQFDKAQDAWGKATLLAHPAELARRYPEVAILPGKYLSTPLPADLRLEGTV